MPLKRPFASISVQGAIIPPHGTLTLCQTRAKKSGILRAWNISDEIQILKPSSRAQEQYPEFKPDHKGEDGFAAFPMGYGNPNILFEILELNDNLHPGENRALPEEDLTRITEPGSKWPMTYLVEVVPAPPGSDQSVPKNYMGYDRTHWKVYDQPVVTGPILGDVIMIDTGKIIQGYETKENEIGYVIENKTFVVKQQPRPFQYKQNNALESFLDTIGTSGCVSLIQKAIRRRPQHMTHPDTQEIFDTRHVVIAITSHNDIIICP